MLRREGFQFISGNATATTSAEHALEVARMTLQSRTTVQSPMGALELCASSEGIRSIRWVEEAAEAKDSQTSGLLLSCAEQLSQYFAGQRQTFDLPLDPIGTPFQLRAWEFLSSIPFGESRSYGQQARALGDMRLARAVGGANGRNPIPIVIPCHRVIAADGQLGGFSSGIERKIWLLEHERLVANV